jgi:uncharacterized phage infection (PIP) family protein YhgE
MINMIALFILKFIPLQVSSGPSFPTNLYFIFFILGVILIIIILAIRVYIIEKKEKKGKHD